MSSPITASDLELFQAIDRGGSLSGAGRTLGIEQSTVSRRLTALEQRIGGALFVRSREGVIPTALGLSWRKGADLAEQGVLLARRSTYEQIGGVSGKVRIATLLSIGDLMIAPNLPKLLARHPHLQVSILASGAVADLGRLEADLALRLFRPQTGDFIVRLLMKTTLHTFATAGLQDQIRHLPLRDWPWLGWAHPRLAPPEETAWFAQEGIVPQVTCLSPTTALQLLRAGVGVGFLGTEVGQMFPELVPIYVPSMPTIEIKFWLVVHRELRNVPRIAAVWDWLVEIASSIES